jgi:predicted nucleic acid-binding protein
VSVYLDASVLVSFFLNDAFTTRADSFFRANSGPLLVSDFAATEFSSVVAREVRTGTISDTDARSAFADFDAWTARTADRAETQPSDILAADAYVRRLDLVLRAPDAINIAIAQRCGSALATFDRRMAAGARALGLRVVAL